MLTQRFLLPFQLPKTSRVSALISSAEDETRADVPTGSIDELPKASPCFARQNDREGFHLFWWRYDSGRPLHLLDAVHLTSDTRGLAVNQAQQALSIRLLLFVRPYGEHASVPASSS